MHGSSLNSMFHTSSAFPSHHKAYLWLYESALIYVALVDGPYMNPPVTVAQACGIAQPYWEWDTGFNAYGDKAITIGDTDVFQSPAYFGSMSTPNDTYDVIDGLFSEVDTISRICTPYPANAYCGYKLKRAFFVDKLTIGNQKLRDQIWKYPQFKDYIGLIHGLSHGQVHSFVGCAMGGTDTAGEDPLFYLHHTNIDRLWHLWANCHFHHTVAASDLTDNCTQYVALNPVPVNLPQSQWKALDIYKNRHKVGLDDKVFLYSGSSQAIFCRVDQFPTIRELWTMGTEDEYGWMDLYYRYGPDKMAVRLSADNRCNNVAWSWVNYQN
jgi:hypothetical protein